MSIERAPFQQGQVYVTESESVFEKAADKILADRAERADRAPGNILARPTPTPPRPRATGGKKRIRAELRKGLGGLTVDDINGLTNRVYRRAVRPLLARAFAQGVEAGMDDISRCCGCSGTPEDIENPYEA